MSKQPRLLRAQLAPGPGKGAQWGSGGARRRGGTLYLGWPPVLKLGQPPGAGCPLPPPGLFFYICKLPINIRGQILLPTPLPGSWSQESTVVLLGVGACKGHPSWHVAAQGVKAGTVFPTFPNSQLATRCPAPRHKALAAAQRMPVGKPSSCCLAPRHLVPVAPLASGAIPPCPLSPSCSSAQLSALRGGARRAPQPSPSILQGGEGVNARRRSRRWAQE